MTYNNPSQQTRWSGREVFSYPDSNRKYRRLP